MKYLNLTIIGTSHIAKQSLDEVKETIINEKPDIIALELDEKRLRALLSKRKKTYGNIFRVGLKGYLFSLLGAWVEKKLGEYVGVKPGSEMKTAIRLARRNKIRIALIDQDIEVTLRKLSKRISLKEKWNFIIDILGGIFSKKRKIEFDLTKVPKKSIVKKMIKEVKERYPNIYTILVKERNEIMAERLKELMEKNKEKKILAIVGAGHEEDIIKIIKSKMHSFGIEYSFSVKPEKA